MNDPHTQIVNSISRSVFPKQRGEVRYDLCRSKDQREGEEQSRSKDQREGEEQSRSPDQREGEGLNARP